MFKKLREITSTVNSKHASSSSEQRSIARISLSSFKGNIAEEVFDPNPNKVSISRKTSLRHFELGPIIGTGSFGIVPIAKHRDSGLVVAVKILSKAHVAKTKQIVHIVQEKKILELVKSEFIVKLFSCAHTKEEIHLVMEFVPGGELFNQLRLYRRLKNEVARFYVVEIALAFEYLHEICAKPNRVAYRDLKPENVLLDGYGYVKLADFGFAKQLGPKVKGGKISLPLEMDEEQKVGFIENEKAYTLCGTPDYLAPEVILNGGHDESVDWWALGVLLYELVRGIPPFQAEEPWATYQKILKGEFSFGPKEKSTNNSGEKGGAKKKKAKRKKEKKETTKNGDGCSITTANGEEVEEEVENPFGFTKNSRDLIRKLLKVESANRLCSNDGSIELKTHPWFSSVNWKLASERKWMKPPLIPRCPKSEQELYSVLQKNAEDEGFDEESSARNDTNFVELSSEDKRAFEALDDEEGEEEREVITVET